MLRWFKVNSLLFLAILISGFLNYNPQALFKPTGYYHWGWQCAVLASLIIIGVMKVRNKVEWKNILGINLTKTDLLKFLSLTIGLTCISFFFIPYILSLNNCQFRLLLTDYKQFDNFKYVPFHAIIANYIYYIPQTLNEEMIVGALLLKSIKKAFSSLNDLTLSIIVALVFCLMHQALYKFSPVQPGELLSFITLISLFLVGMLRNQLILRTGKIAYSWAIHLSWNLIFFTNIFINQSTGELASEPRKFNLILGDFRVMTLILIITALVLCWPGIIKTKWIKDVLLYSSRV